MSISRGQSLGEQKERGENQMQFHWRSLSTPAHPLVYLSSYDLANKRHDSDILTGIHIDCRASVTNT